MEMLLILISFLTPIITGITELIKGYVPEKFHALIPLILGLILGPLSFPLLYIIGVEAFSIYILIWAGLLSGLSASGLYSAQNIRNK